MREPEILKAVIAAWDGIATSATLLPGKLHEYMAQDDNVPPSANKWGTVQVTDNGIVRETTGGPIREHNVTITIHADDGIQANSTLMDTLGTIRSVITKAMDNGGTIIDMWPANAKSGQTDNTRRTKTMSELQIAWRVQSRWPY